jgi:hypothetical protein
MFIVRRYPVDNCIQPVPESEVQHNCTYMYLADRAIVQYSVTDIKGHQIL